MAPRSTSFFRTGVPDAPLVQNAQTPFDGPERQVIDQQITDMQKLLAAVLANGLAGTYAKIDGGASAGQAGDVLCRSASAQGTWVKATSSALATAGGVPAGIALAAYQPNSRCPVAVAGLIDPAITGIVLLSPIPYLARVSSAGRVEAVTAYSAGDAPIGAFDAKGWLTLSSGSSAGGAGVPASRTLTGSGAIKIAGDNSAHDLSANRTISIVAATTSVPGTMSAADKTKLDAATATATASVIMMRDDSRITGLSGISVPAGDAWLYAQSQNTTGDGLAATWTGQAAKTGAYNGGPMCHVGGARGDIEHRDGDHRFSVGPEDDNDARSAYVSVHNDRAFGDTPFFRLSSSSSTAHLEVPNGLVIDAGSATILLNAGTHNVVLGTKPTITGSKGGNVALGNLLTALAAMGLITDSTT